LRKEKLGVLPERKFSPSNSYIAIKMQVENKKNKNIIYLKKDSKNHKKKLKKKKT
jgi:hypothetical protein